MNPRPIYQELKSLSALDIKVRCSQDSLFTPTVMPGAEGTVVSCRFLAQIAFDRRISGAKRPGICKREIADGGRLCLWCSLATFFFRICIPAPICG